MLTGHQLSDGSTYTLGFIWLNQNITNMLNITAVVVTAMAVAAVDMMTVSKR